MNTQLLVLAKEPVPGRVKTRLCPPASPAQAAALAGAALADTLDTVAATPADHRVLVLAGHATVGCPPGVCVRRQRGDDLGDRLANAYADTRRHDTASLLVGMDTPQLTPTLLCDALARLRHVDAVLGPAVDGGWWSLGLREPRYGAVLRGVPMSTPDTGEHTEAALRAAGLRVARLPLLRDVDTAADARLVAAELGDRPGSTFAAASRRLLGAGQAA